MKPTLTFEKMEILRGESGSFSSLPDLGGMKILQNQLTFHLGETEEIYDQIEGAFLNKKDESVRYKNRSEDILIKFRERLKRAQ